MQRKGVDIKVKLVDKAAMDRSGAVACGLSAINISVRAGSGRLCAHGL